MIAFHLSMHEMKIDTDLTVYQPVFGMHVRLGGLVILYKPT